METRKRKADIININFVSTFKTIANTLKYIQSLLKIGCNQNTVEMENYSSLEVFPIVINAHYEKHFYTYSHLTSLSRDGQIHFLMGFINTQESLCTCVCLPFYI